MSLRFYQQYFIEARDQLALTFTRNLAEERYREPVKREACEAIG